MNFVKSALRLAVPIVIGTVCWLPLPAFGGGAVWRVQSPAVKSQLPVVFEPNVAPDGLVIVPLLNAQRELLPGGRFRVWIGHRNGVPLANRQVTFRTRSSDNLLVENGSATSETTVRTDSDGVAEVYVTPRPRSGADDGGSGDDGGGGPPPT